MALPHVPYAAQTAPTMSELDDTFAALGALSVIPCSATGLSAQVLTPKTTPSTPTVSAYADNQVFSFVPAAGNLGPVTVNVNGLGALNLYLANGSQVSAAGSLRAGTLYIIAYSLQLNSGAGGFQLLSGINTASKLVQRIVTQTSTPSLTLGTIIINASSTPSAEKGVQVLTATLTPVAGTNNILAFATVFAATSSTGDTRVAIFQGSTFMSSSYIGATSDLIGGHAVSGNIALTNVSSLSFQVRAMGVLAGNAQVSINRNTLVTPGGITSSLILEEWTTGT